MTDHSDGIEDVNKLKAQYCLNMARSPDAQAARRRDDSYLRKLISEQAAKYRTRRRPRHAKPTNPAHIPPGNVRQGRVP
jgi:hypothetical protein